MKELHCSPSLKGHNACVALAPRALDGNLLFLLPGKRMQKADGNWRPAAFVQIEDQCGQQAHRQPSALWGERMCPVIWLNLKRLPRLLISNCYFATKILSFTLAVRTDTGGRRRGGLCIVFCELLSLIWVTLAAVWCLCCSHIDSDGRLLSPFSSFLAFHFLLSALFFCMVFCWNFGLQVP